MSSCYWNCILPDSHFYQLGGIFYLKYWTFKVSNKTKLLSRFRISTTPLSLYIKVTRRCYKHDIDAGIDFIFDWFLIEMTKTKFPKYEEIRFSLMFKTATVMLHIDQNIFVL